MSSEIKANKWSPATGTAATLGDSSDTFTVPSGVTLDIASGATIDATGATITGWPSGGITHASIWDMNTTFSGTSNPITTNWVESNSVYGYDTLGASMTQSSGVFTFPTTGYWLISWNVNFQIDNANSRYNNIYIDVTTDDGTYANAAVGRVALYDSGGWTYQSAPITWLFDVTSVSTHKCRFGVNVQNSSTQITQSMNNGTNDPHGTAVTFIRLADT